MYSKIPPITRPKITFNRLGQLIFVFKETFKLAYKARPRMLVGIIVVNILWGLSSVPGFYIEKLIIDRLLEGIGSNNINDTLYLIAILIFTYLILQLIRNLLSSLNRLMGNLLSNILSAEIGVLIGEKLSELDMQNIEDPEFRNKFEKIERESRRRAWDLIIPLANIPNYLFGFIAAMVVISAISPFLALIMLAISIPKLVAHKSFIKKEYELNTHLSDKHRLWGWLEYYLVRNKNFMEMKILNLSNPLTDKLRSTIDYVIEKQYKHRKSRYFFDSLTEIPLIIFELLFSVFVAYRVLIGVITIGTFQLFIRSIRSAQQNLTSLVQSFMEIYENYIYIADLVWFLDLEPEIDNKSSEGEKVEEINTIKFRDVWFKYRDESAWIIKGASFEVKKGEKIAIVGENGMGKTTLIKLLSRFYDPTKGEILLNDKKLSQYNVRSWWKKLAVLFQQFEHYEFSVTESIGYGDIQRINNTKDIKEAAKKSGIADFIDTLPLKYNNPITPQFDKGVEPSIGQWQRFGIARMLFRKNADIIILDEPTSNVDPEAEEKIFKELKKISKNKILIFVTQRFSTVRIADRIMVVHNGKITEFGTHKELMKKIGRYARLFRIQADAYKET